MEDNKVFVCPNCAKPLTDQEKCYQCGWVPGMYMTDGEIKDAVSQWLDDKKDMGITPAQADVGEIADEIGGATIGKVRAYKREYLKDHNMLVRAEEVQKEAIATQRRLRLQEEELVARERRIPEPAANPGQPMAGGIPDWALQPYRAQIDMLKADLDRERRRYDELEKDYRDKILAPPGEGKFSELESKLMDRFTNYALQGGQPKSWVEELVGGLVGSGQLGTILEEGAGLMSDLRHKNDPDHNPYEDVKFQQPQPPAVKQTVPRPKPNGVKQQAQAQPQQPQQTQQEEDAEYSPEDLKQLVKQTYPKIPEDVVDTAVDAAEAELPNASAREKVVAAIETLKAVAMLRDIGIGMKQVVQGNIPVDTAAKYMMKNHPKYARSLAEHGYEVWLEKGKYFLEHPQYGKDLEFLNRDEVRNAMGMIVGEVRRILQEG